MRLPAVAGRFYPSEKEGLLRSIEQCFTDRLGPGLPGEIKGERTISGMMVPHAGYMASGPNAARAYRRLKEDGRPEAYVIIGPDHHGLGCGPSLCSEDFLTPLGVCKVHKGIAEELSNYIINDPGAHRFEHSIEVQVPFIQYIDPEAEIVPIMMSDQSPEEAVRLADAIGKACEGHDVVFIASSDMSHYVPKEEAERLDNMVLDKIADMDWIGVYNTVANNEITMCGYGPVATVMRLCSGCVPEMLGHTDSYDSLGMDSESVVGYSSALFVEERRE